MNIFVLDNYDSFTFNLVQYLAGLGSSIEVGRNDRVSADEIAALDPDAIVISPGPGNPAQAGISLEVVRRFGTQLPILGVCLGHQTIGEAYGATIRRARIPMHGKTCRVLHDGRGVFGGLESPLQVVRYHSLVIDPATLPDCLEVSARSEEGEIMGVRHRTLLVEGVQFHPESIFTDSGMALVKNFVSLVRAHRRAAPGPGTAPMPSGELAHADR